MNIKLDPNAHEPIREYSTDAGLDLKTMTRGIIKAQGNRLIDTGVAVELPKGCVGLVLPKSGLTSKGIVAMVGVIDEGYTGTIRVNVRNMKYSDFEYEQGQKIAQLVILEIRRPKVKVVEKLGFTERGTNGFGSTGKF